MKRSKRSSYDDDDDDRYHKHEISKNHQIKRFRSMRKSSSSSDYYHHHKNFKIKPKKNSSDENEPQKKKLKAYKVSKKYYEAQSEDDFSNQLKLSKKCCRSTLEKFSDMQYYYWKSGKYLAKRKLNKAMQYICMARQLCKTKDKFLAKIYARRGTINAELHKPKCNFQSFLDWEHAYKLDEQNIEARENMAEVLFMGANLYYRTKNYEESLVPAQHAYKLLSSGKTKAKAYMLLKLIKKKLLMKEVDEIRGRTAMMKSFKKSSMRASTSKMEKIPKKKHFLILTSSSSASDSNCEKLLDEVKRLHELTVKALKTSNYPQALILVNKALELYNDEISDDGVFRELFRLKQKIINAIHHDASTSNNVSRYEKD